MTGKKTPGPETEVHCMRGHAFLIAGSEYRHKRPIAVLRRYLLENGFAVDWWSVGYNPLCTLLQLHRNVKRATSTKLPFLLAYHGHGAKKGWGHKGSGILAYHLITASLKRLGGSILVLNDCCYGGWMLPYLKRARAGQETGLIVPQNARGVSDGGPCESVPIAWSQRARPEDACPGIIHMYLDLEGPGSYEEERPIVMRWGDELDHLFFPETVPG